MSWNELRDLSGENAVWEIPGNRTKNKRSHIVPLQSDTQQLLSRMPRTSDLVFTTNGKSPVSGFGKAKARLDERIATMRRSDQLEPVSAWTFHDLRRTMVTVMNEKLGITPHVVEAVVNHMSGLAKAGVAGVYNRALYFEDRRRALLLWQNWLHDLNR